MPLANKGKGKGREVRQSRSRNTTPSSGLSSSTTTGASSVPGYLDNDVSKLFSSSTVQYADILERLGGGGTIPDSKTLELLGEHLKTLSQLADARGDVCNAGMRELSQRRKEVLEDQQEQMERDAEERIKMKREAEDDEDCSRALKGGKLKKRKERASKEDRPLAVGAHEITRQDGGELGELFLPQTPPRFFFCLSLMHWSWLKKQGMLIDSSRRSETSSRDYLSLVQEIPASGLGQHISAFPAITSISASSCSWRSFRGSPFTIFGRQFRIAAAGASGGCSSISGLWTRPVEISRPNYLSHS